MFSTLLKTADKFLDKFNLRRLKFGTIMEFLDKFGMQQSKDALGNVMEEIKVCYIFKPGILTTIINFYVY